MLKNEDQVNTPVDLLLFNRPSIIAKLLEVIRVARPPQILVIADGSRKDNQSDLEKCSVVGRINR